MIRILLVDDQALLCEVLKTWLEVEEDFEVIGVAHNGSEALSKIEMQRPDIILMDIDMPEMNGLDATKIITERFPEVKVIFLSGHEEDDYLGKSIRAGAKGYLLKNTTAEELAEKIRHVHCNSSSLALSTDNEMIKTAQNQLEELIESYRQKFQKQWESNDRIGSVLSEYDRKLQEIEISLLDKQQECLQQIKQENRLNDKSLHQEIQLIKTKLNDTNHELSSQLNQQLVNLRKDVDIELNKALEDWSRQRSALQEWAVQRDEMRFSVEEFQSKYEQKLMTAISPFRTSFRDVDRQIRHLRNWLIGTILLAIMSLSFSSWIIASNFIDGNSRSSQVNNR